MTKAVRAPLKKVIGFIFPKIQSNAGKTTTPWKIVVPVTTTANSTKRLNTERSSVAINLASNAKIPIGASFITQPTSIIIMTKNCWQVFRTKLKLSPPLTNATPRNNAKTTTASTLPSLNALKGLIKVFWIKLVRKLEGVSVSGVWWFCMASWKI